MFVTYFTDVDIETVVKYVYVETHAWLGPNEASWQPSELQYVAALTC